MCEIISSENQEIVADQSSEKMKRMAIALKAVGGWFSYFMGISALAFGTLTDIGTDMFIVIIGIGIIIPGLVLLHQHVKQKALTGKARIVKGVKYIGGLLLIPGVLGILIGKSSPLLPFCQLLAFSGLLIFVISIILKKAWGLKSPKRIKSEPA